MDCSHCGAAEQHSKAYCRQCGTWIGSSAPEERMAVIIISNALCAVLAAASAIALFPNLNKGAEWPIHLAAVFCVMISVYQTLSFLFALRLQLRLKKAKAQRELDSPREVSTLRAADTSQFVRAPSVTERTTDLLERKN